MIIVLGVCVMIGLIVFAMPIRASAHAQTTSGHLTMLGIALTLLAFALFDGFVMLDEWGSRIAAIAAIAIVLAVMRSRRTF